MESSGDIDDYSNSFGIYWGWNYPKIKEIDKLYHVVSNNKTNKKVNDVVDNKLEFIYSSSLANDHIIYPQPRVILI